MKNLIIPIWLFLLLLANIPCLAQIELMNDEFDDATSLSNWQNISVTEGWGIEQLESHDINTTEPSHLMMMPYTSSWYEDWRGTLLFKTVTGDFTFTTQVTATNRAGNGIPSSNYSLAGVMIRTARNITNGAADWTPNGENYVFLAIGQASDQHHTLPTTPTPGPHFEVKTTVNGNSNLEVSGINTSTDVQIRLVRLGDFVICLYRLPSQNWVVHRRFYRPDIPATVQIGFVTYTDWDKCFTYMPSFHNSHVLNNSLSPDPSSNPGLAFNPDLIATFDFGRFTDVSLPASLVGQNLTSTTNIPDADLLAFLDFPSQPYANPTTNIRIRALLQGTYNSGGMMHTNLQTVLPMQQPYNRAPWNYNSSDAISNIPNNMTDWVLIEIRDGTNANVIIEQKAALLLSDGQIVDVSYANNSSVNGVLFNNLNNGQDYYILIRHRNHVDVASLNTVNLPNVTPYDFSVATNVMGGTSQLNTENDGQLTMLAGDQDSNGIITVSDFNGYQTAISTINDYNDSDFDMDNTVTVGDFNIYQSNSSKIGVALIRY